MNERIEELYQQSFIEVHDEDSFPCRTFSKKLFAELIVQECIDNLLWHGEDDAVAKLEWFKINKLGIK